ncbi:MAG TPA: diadenylate cyclase, partial [Anaerolineae bacterium]
RSTAELAEIVKRIAAAANTDAVLCITQSGRLAKQLSPLLPQSTRIIAATFNRGTAQALRQQGLDTVHLPAQAANKYNQVRHALGVAVQSSTLAVGDLVVCAFGRNVYPAEGDLIVVTDVGIEAAQQGNVGDLLRLTDGIQPKVLEAALVLGCRIGQVVRRGAERIGAIFALGDSRRVLQGSRQLVPNPFHGHDDALRRITNPDLHTALVEFAKLDGAFVIRGDGYIESAGVFLATTEAETTLPTGLGTRHLAAAATTARTEATAIVVSATDGNVRVFADGNLVLQLDPDVPYGPITLDEQGQGPS